MKNEFRKNLRAAEIKIHFSFDMLTNMHTRRLLPTGSTAKHVYIPHCFHFTVSVEPVTTGVNQADYNQ